jgi:predicted PurR-regulated permease PerM
VSILMALTFMLCIAQIGAFPVLVPACIWLYWSGDHGWGTFMVVWTLIVGNIDAVLRPVLIKRGANLPLLLILTGVIGGLIGFGLVGIFLGPLVLAISYTMIVAWVNESQNPNNDAAGQD